jgi:hypothetical protein
MHRPLAIVIVVCLCAKLLYADVQWDNNVQSNGKNGRAISPPLFPNIRVVDDIEVHPGGWSIDEIALHVVEDATFNGGNRIQVYIYEDSDAQPGSLVLTREGSYRRAAWGCCYFGRSDYRYVIGPSDIDPILLSGGRMWIGFRNSGAGGAGTNYWLTSDGGPDGSDGSTGYFSLDAGSTWQAEHEGWHHAFVLGDSTGPPGACCLITGQCLPDLSRSECDAADGEWGGRGVPCEQAECVEGTGACCRSGACSVESGTSCVSGGCVRYPEWQCDGDVDGDGGVNPIDAGLVQSAYCRGEQCSAQQLCQYDMDCDRQINPSDSGIVQSLFGSCHPPRDTCDSDPGEFLGYGTGCDQSSCDLGACCEAGVCVETVRWERCAGSWYVDEQCPEFHCPGACCDGEACSERGRADCKGLGYRFLDYDTTCVREPCRVGACCTGTECLEAVARYDCEAFRGVFFEDPGICEAVCGSCEVSGRCRAAEGCGIGCLCLEIFEFGIGGPGLCYGGGASCDDLSPCPNGSSDCTDLPDGVCLVGTCCPNDPVCVYPGDYHLCANVPEPADDPTEPGTSTVGGAD